MCIVIVGHRKMLGAFAGALPAFFSNLQSITCIQSVSSWVELDLLLGLEELQEKWKDLKKQCYQRPLVTFDLPTSIIFLIVSCLSVFLFAKFCELSKADTWHDSPFFCPPFTTHLFLNQSSKAWIRCSAVTACKDQIDQLLTDVQGAFLESCEMIFYVEN